MVGLLKKIMATAILAASAVSSMPSQSATPTIQDLHGVSVVLVHGAFADGSSWNRVIPLLEARGLHVVAIQNPLSSLANDVAAARRAIDQQTGPVVLVGHSWGGVVISEAGNDPKVSALVYVAALVPDNGQSVNDILKGKPQPPWASHLQKDAAGYLTLETDTVIHDFSQDLPVAESRLIAATQGPWFAGCFDDKISTAAWHFKPSTYVIAGNDRMIDPRLQEGMAAEIGAAVVHVNTSHVAMLGQPRQVADAIIAAAMKTK